MAAQRFPQMFDGVVAGFPGFRLATAGAVAEVWDTQAFAEVSRQAGALDGDGLPLLGKSFTDADLALASEAVLAACDALDGTVDGMIEDFPHCDDAKVYPRLAAITCAGAKQENCLSALQVAALKKVYGGARTRDGRPLYASWPWDAGLGGAAPNGYFHGWRDWKIGGWDAPRNTAINIVLAGGAVSAIFVSPPTDVAANPAALTRYMLGASVDANDAASKAKWGAFHESSVDFMNADATDLSAFAGHGGKLLVYHGVSDPVFSINDTIAWWQAVDRRERGRSGRFLRLFAVPGMNHGGGGPSTDQFDAFGALVNWVEKGVAPDSMVATARPGTNWPGRTRLLCPYPQQPRRQGGDGEHADSFHCTTP
jgi:feruloyl esterase